MWQTVTNIGAVLGVILAGYNLWNLYRSQLRLKAKAKQFVFEPMPHVDDDIKQFLTLLRNSRYEGPKEQRALAEKLIEALPKTVIAEYREGQLFDYKYRWTVEVQNAGKLEVKDLRLHVPFKGFYVTDREPKKVVEFDKEIPLEAMRARAVVVVTIWSNEVGSAYVGSRGMHLTHSTGDVPVSLPQPDYDTSTSQITLSILSAAVLGMFVSALIIMLTGAFRGDTQPAATQPAATRPATQP